MALGQLRSERCGVPAVRWLGQRRVGRRVAAALALALAAVGTVIGLLGADADRSRAHDLSDGSAWFASTSTGRAVLMDGASGTATIRVPVADQKDSFEVVPFGADALVINHTKGVLRRIGGARWEVDEPVPLLIASPGDDRVSVRAGRDVVWIVSTDPALAYLPSSTTLLAEEGEEPVTLPAGIEGRNLHATRDGVLWALGPSGDLRSYRDGRAQTAVELSGVRDARLVLAGDRPVVVDPAGHALLVIDPVTGEPGRRLAFDAPATRDLIVAGAGPSSSVVMAVAPEGGVLYVADVDRGEVTPIALKDPPGRRSYGEPVEKGGLVFIPHVGEIGEVVIVDPAAPPNERVRPPIPLGGFGIRNFTLAVHGGRVWFDERPPGDQAGVITDDLTAKAIVKGAEDGSTRPRSTDTSVPPGSSTSSSTTPPGPQPPGPQPPGPTTPATIGQGPTRRLVELDVPARAVVGEPVTLHDRTLAPHTIDRWEITGAAVSQPRAPDPVVTFPSPGRYTVKLMVRWDDGSGGAAQRPIDVVAASRPPSATTTTTTLPPPPTVQPTTTVPPPPTTRPTTTLPPPPPTTVPTTQPPPPPRPTHNVRSETQSFPGDYKVFADSTPPFTDQTGAVGQGVTIQVWCKRQHPQAQMPSNPDNYWYKLASPHPNQWGPASNYEDDGQGVRVITTVPDCGPGD
jgi:hypothetical protein